LLVVCEGIQGALLHGNGEVGEQSAGRLVGCGPQRRNGAVAVGFVQRNGGSRNSKYLRTKERTRQRRLTLTVVALRFYRARAICGSGNDGERYVPGSNASATWMGEVGLGWPVKSPIATSRGLDARPKGESAFDAAGSRGWAGIGSVLGCVRSPLRVSLFSKAAAISSSAVAMTNLPAN
jgi:hypothetical protein